MDMRGSLLDGVRWALALMLGTALCGIAPAQAAEGKPDRADQPAVLQSCSTRCCGP
jgi:hypothetical protein